MTYDAKLAERIRHVLPATSSIAERKMFGGLAFLLDGKMFVGVADTDLMVRVGAEAYEDALAMPHVRPMDFTGRPLTGFVFVGASGVRTTAAVSDWVQMGLQFVATLPTKTPRPRRPRASAKRPRPAKRGRSERPR